ncbi:MAG: ABC transporter ATP-binding protein [Coriobacteriia bacterium]|nr:ABC transporter ATP-binding protein [Coriobacteriia bacterium]
MSAIVSCDNVSIRYITGDFKDIGLKEYLIRRLTKQYHVTEFWADRHVTFELQPGDMLGIIGSNGAGKSTLLKAISGIMVPTEGTVRCSAKISALLELASGFDGDLTVRENTYLRAAMLGYSREFVDGMYDSIIDFAELQDFQDRPFKQLSSGMKSRLAFSIASLVDPEILILDEVLSVGDGAFRKKSEAKMRQIINGGATTILVSHSVGQVRSLCNKILWLNRGEQVAFGTNVQGLCDAYQKFLDTKVLPKPEELPPLDLPGAEAPRQPASLNSEADASAKAPTPEVPAPDDPTICGSLGSRILGAVSRLPRAVSITIIAVLILTATIAVSEASLPSRVRALPQNADRVIYVSSDLPAPATVCAWDGRLYLFMDRSAAQGATLGIRATDNHGNVTTDAIDITAHQTKRYGTEQALVLEVNLAKYPGAVEVEYGLLASSEGATGASESDDLPWLWHETYRP